MAYLLDYEYTRRGLSWDRLKGADADRAALLRAAAEDAGCEAVLALTEIKETWDTEPGRGRGVHLTYIITSELTLGWWTGVPGGEPISLYVPEEQVCASTPLADLKPYDSEYTGYMGNYGNTVDRWYRRAAVVVWPGQHAFAARAEASPSWALTELRARLGAGDLVNARAAAESVAPFWKAPGPELLEPALHTAAGLEDPVPVTGHAAQAACGAGQAARRAAGSRRRDSAGRRDRDGPARARRRRARLPAADAAGGRARTKHTP